MDSSRSNANGAAARRRPRMAFVTQIGETTSQGARREEKRAAAEEKKLAEEAAKAKAAATKAADLAKEKKAADRAPSGGAESRSEGEAEAGCWTRRGEPRRRPSPPRRSSQPTPGPARRLNASGTPRLRQLRREEGRQAGGGCRRAGQARCRAARSHSRR